MTFRLTVADRHVVVVNPLPRSTATVAGLLASGARVTVVAERLEATLDDLVQRGRVAWTPELTLELVETADAIVRDTDPVTPPAAPSGGLGSVTLVGGGPGDPGLVSLAGREAIEKADLIVADRLIPHAALAWARPGTEVVDVAKIPHGRSTPQQEINQILVEAARAGRHVVRLKGGDGFVFGRGAEEVLACAAAGVSATVVPGLSSSIAVPAAAGIPLTHRGLSQGFAVVSGHVAPDDPASTVDWDALATSGLTVVILMGVGQLAAITERLVAAGMSPTSPAAVIADGTLPSQQVVRSSLGRLAHEAARAGIGSPAITVIGEVAGLEVPA